MVLQQGQAIRIEIPGIKCSDCRELRNDKGLSSCILMRIAEFRVYSSIVSPCLLPVLKGGHQSRGQDSREDRDERIVVGRAGGEDRQGQVEAGDEDSGLQ